MLCVGREKKDISLLLKGGGNSETHQADGRLHLFLLVGAHDCQSNFCQSPLLFFFPRCPADASQCHTLASLFVKDSHFVPTVAREYDHGRKSLKLSCCSIRSHVTPTCQGAPAPRRPLRSTCKGGVDGSALFTDPQVLAALNSPPPG